MYFDKFVSVFTAFSVVLGFNYNIFGSAARDQDQNSGTDNLVGCSERLSSTKQKKLEFKKHKIGINANLSKDNLTDEDKNFNIILKLSNTNRKKDDRFNINILLNQDSCLELEMGINNLKNIQIQDVSEFEIPIKINKTFDDKQEIIRIVLTRNICDLENNTKQEIISVFEKQILVRHVRKKAVIIVPGIVGSEIFSATSQVVGGVQYAEDHRIWPPEDTSKIINKVMRTKECDTYGYGAQRSNDFNFIENSILNLDKYQIIDTDEDDNASEEDYNNTSLGIISSQEDYEFERFPIRIMGLETKRIIRDFGNLICNEDGSSKLKIKPSYPFNCRTEGKERFFGSADVYSNLANNIVSDKSFKDYDVIFFSYDWRRSNSDSARELKKFIDENYYSNVVLVAHSMGGLVCTSYLTEKENRQKVDKFIALGTPFLGANKAINVVETGEFFDGLIGAVVAPVANNLIKNVVKNCPSVYELFPPRQIFEKTDEKILEKINVSYRFCGCFSSKKSRAVKAFDEFVDLLSNRWTSYIYNIPNISNFLSKAQNFHDSLYTQSGESILNSEDIDFYNIVGCGLSTIGTTQIIYDMDEIDDTGRISYSQVADGDGTVTVSSATIANTTLQEKSYRVHRVDHMGLISDESVINLVINIITDRPYIYDDGTIDQIFLK
ncbi:MAG: hypothetical protein J6C55_02785 [Oscillospiraceae bacterium]|nr:hypothetical protein [Oscillospiraceae bacterium]